MWESSRGRGKSGAVDHGGIVKTFSSQNQTDTEALPKIPASLVIKCKASLLVDVLSDFHTGLYNIVGKTHFT